MRTYDFTITREDGTTVDVSLRLSADAQRKLKDQYKGEPTYNTFTNAMDDPARLIDIVGMSLKYKDNHNAIQSGTELIDLMTDAGMLGFDGRAALLCAILRVSGIVNDAEHDKILKNYRDTIKHAILQDFDDLDGVGTEEVKKDSKNA